MKKNTKKTEKNDQFKNNGQFAKGNSMWRLAKITGRPRVIESADELIELANEYFDHVDNTPWKTIDFKGKDAVKCEIPVQKPYLKGDFARFCGFSTWERLCNYKERGDDFCEILTCIEDIIVNHKLSGATSGIFNATVVCRDLGLKDKQEMEGKMQHEHKNPQEHRVIFEDYEDQSEED